MEVKQNKRILLQKDHLLLRDLLHNLVVKQLIQQKIAILPYGFMLKIIRESDINQFKIKINLKLRNN